MNGNNANGVLYDPAGHRLTISNLHLTDSLVLTEARRWADGCRGELQPEEDLNAVDLTPFVTQAMSVGSAAIAAAGGVQEKFNLAELVQEVGTRTSQAAAEASACTTRAVAEATATVERVSTAATKNISEAGSAARKAFAENVDEARKSMSAELDRLVGSENSELRLRLEPLFATFAQQLNDGAVSQTNSLIAGAAGLLDPTDPQSPMAKHLQAMQVQNLDLISTLELSSKEVASKVEQLTVAVKVDRAAADAIARTTKVTPLKGDTFAQQVNTVMNGIATGLGAEYTDLSTREGSIPGCKKGDGVLDIDGGAVRIVMEMTDSSRPGWNSYLEEAERNRGAVASLGLVRHQSQLKGDSIRCLTGRRLLLAFDPETDDPGLLRTVVQLLQIGARAAASRQNSGEVETATEKVAEALALLVKIDGIKKHADSIRKTATKIETESESVRADLTRLLAAAQDALRGAGIEGVAVAA